MLTSVAAQQQRKPLQLCLQWEFCSVSGVWSVVLILEKKSQNASCYIFIDSCAAANVLAV